MHGVVSLNNDALSDEFQIAAEVEYIFWRYARLRELEEFDGVVLPDPKRMARN